MSPTLENSALILFFSFFWSEPRSHVWFGCDERFTWLAVLTRTQFFVSRYLFSWILRKLSCPWYLHCFDQQSWNLVTIMREHLNGAEHLCNFCLLITLCVPVNVWNDTEKIGMSLRRCGHSSIEKCSQVLRCTVSAILCLFPLSSQGRSFCIDVASYGHVSLIVDQLDWAVLSISFVALSRSGRGITGESLRNLKIVIGHNVI